MRDSSQIRPDKEVDKRQRARVKTGRSLTVTGLFRDESSAQCAYESLIHRGYDRASISLLMPNGTSCREFPKEQSRSSQLEKPALRDKGLQAASAGAAMGPGAGALMGAVAAVGILLVIPGLGLTVAGPIAAAFSGSRAAGVTGGLIDALAGSGIPKERAMAFESIIKGGGILISLSPRDGKEADNIELEWNSLGGELIQY